MRYILLLIVAALTQPPASNLLRNGSFDRDLRGWVMGRGVWALDESTGSGAAKALNPPYRYRGQGVAAVRDGIWQCVRIDNDREYELRFRSRMSAEFARLGHGGASLTWFSNPDCAVQPKLPTGGIVGTVAGVRLAVSDGRWHELTLASGRPPRDARSVEIMLESVATQLDYENNIEVWFDDVIFSPVVK